jgi:hypothetical protein
MVAKQQEQRPATRSGGHDVPISGPEEDFLGAIRTALAIHRTIQATPSGWSTRVGLYGAWGSGKTSILNLLERLEDEDRAIVVRCSAWSAGGESGVLMILYEELAKRLRQEEISPPLVGRAKRIAAKARWIPRLLGIGIRAAKNAPLLPEGAGDAIAEAAESAFGWLVVDRKDVDALVQQLGGRRVTVFVDDLDRADPKLIPKTLLALRELLDWPSFTFVLAFDQRVVARALSDYSAAYGENARLFLEKVVDVEFEVPPATEEQKKALALHAFKICCPFVPVKTVSAMTAYLPDEPRRIKLIARKLGVMSSVATRHGPDELDWSALVKYDILHEASPEAARFAIDAATNSEENWLLWAGNESEKTAKSKEIKASIEAFVPMAAGPTECQRVATVAMSLIQQWAHVNAENVRYLERLLFEEPTFTRRELEALVVKWREDGKDTDVSKAIARARKVAHSSEEKAASDLLVLAASAYSECLQRMTDAETVAAHLEQSGEAAELLLFLEYVWLRCSDPDIRRAAKQGPATPFLVAKLSHWVGWNRNEGELELRRREHDLALQAAVSSDEQETVYSDTDPYWNSHHDGGVGPAAEWRQELRSALSGKLVEGVLARFCLPDGLRDVASGDDKLATWLVESVKSPLYADQRHATRLKEVLRASRIATPEAAGSLRDNARLYLHILLFQTRTASWGGKEQIGQIQTKFPDIIPAAWEGVSEFLCARRWVELAVG